jgi:hypothetical protein
MAYTIYTIVPYSLVGRFERLGIHYKFNFINSMPTIGHLYVYGSDNVGKITENVFVFQSITNRNFDIVYEKLSQAYGLEISSNVIELPTFILDQLQYKILLSGTNKDSSGFSNEPRNINVYFTPEKKIVLDNGKQIQLKENNINDFLNKINDYILE